MKRRELLVFSLGSLASMPVWAQQAEKEIEADVIVVGGGAGGLSAALTAAEKGLKVCLIEKQPMLGGDTLRSGGFFNAVDPEGQERLGIQDSVELFESQIMESGRGYNSADVVHVYARECTESLVWLKKHGLKFSEEIVEIYGSVWPRAHRPLSAAGIGYIQTLSEKAYAKNVEILLNSSVIALIRNPKNDRVSGVYFVQKGKSYICKAAYGVILAPGGFAANSKMVGKYVPAYEDLAYDSHPGATGECLFLAENIGAQLVNMDFIECVPGTNPEISYPVRLDYDPARVLIVNENGRRFTNETGMRSQIAYDFFNRNKGKCFSIADAEAVAAIEPLRQKNLYRGLYANAVWRAPTIAELAEKIGVPEKNLVEEAGSERGRKILKTAPFWASRVFFRRHATLGGVKINPLAQCLDKNDRPVLGLWATGQIIGNVHGFNRLGGNGINCAVTFGRIAGQNIA